MRNTPVTVIIVVFALGALCLLGAWGAYYHFHYRHLDDDRSPPCGDVSVPAKRPDAKIDVKFDYPVIAGYGGIVPVPGAVEAPRKGSKVVFDVTADAKEPGKVVPALERIAMLLNLGGQAGLKPGEVQIAAVLYGNATSAALSDAAYEKREGRPNPNAELLRLLKAAGVDIYVCGQALARKGYDPKDVRGEFRIATAALTAVMNKQAEGFAYVPSH